MMMIPATDCDCRKKWKYGKWPYENEIHEDQAKRRWDQMVRKQKKCTLKATAQYEIQKENILYRRNIIFQWVWW